MKPAEQYTRRTDLGRVARKLEDAGDFLLTQARGIRDPLAYPQSLGLALFAAADLARVISSRKKAALDFLFDGGEDGGPNLDTRMRCIRDLCSAALYGVEGQRKRVGGVFDFEFSVEPPKPARQLWQEIVEKHANAKRPNTVQEVTQFLDDVFESLLCIVECVNAIAQRDNRAWAEVSRHCEHIRDHFDYAEEWLIDSLWPAKGG